MRTATGARFADARAVADAVLYEGYLLYPYRKSSPKNRVRWQFGVLAPRPWVEAHGGVVPTVAGSGDSWFQQTECLVEAPPEAAVHVRVRFLQLQHKQVEVEEAAGHGFRPVESLEAAGAVHLTFDEAVEREFDVVLPLADVGETEVALPTGVPGGQEVEPLPDRAGRIVRTRWPVALTIRVRAERADAPFPLHRLRVRIENECQGLDPAASRDEALRLASIATHAFVAVTGGRFVSLLEPPEWASAAAAASVNLFAFPVLVGEAGSRDLVLCSPIILYDHPRVAPESPGDLFDATEIDEILSLRTATLTDEEKREARATDRRAAAIVDRVDAMPPEVLQRMHGAIRSLRPIRTAEPHPGVVEADPPRAGDPPWWSPEADRSVSPESDAVLVGGVSVSRGSRVRLRPRAGGADAHDMFLRDRIGRVEGVFHDVDGSIHLAVSLEDDSAGELRRWYGRFLYFSPEEVEPVPGPSPEGVEPVPGPVEEAR
jgi:hypothetical protein